MKITRIEVFQIETPRYYGYISGHVVFKVHTDEGLAGLGEGSDSRAGGGVGRSKAERADHCQGLSERPSIFLGGD